MRYQLVLVFTLILNTKSSAQELFVYSDLALFAQKNLDRIDCDSALAFKEHEILSPALERGEFLTLLVVVKHLPGQAFVLQTGQYPPSALSVRSYRLFPGTDAPLEMNLVPNSFSGRIPEGKRCAIFVIDAEVPVDMAQGRLKLEPALWASGGNASNTWIRYPMEVRIMKKRVEDFEIDRECSASENSLKRLLIRNASRENMNCRDIEDRKVDLQSILQQRRQRGKNQ